MNEKQTNPITSAFVGIPQRLDLKDETYISWLRCSGITQVDTSPDGQKEVNDAFAAFQQMRWAGYDVYADAVSGSQTFNREDIEEILYLKRTRNDFTKVIVFELGRATRGGIQHGNVVENELRKAGIELISSTELIPDGPIGDLIKAVKHFSNQQTAYNISKSVARGLAQSLAKSSRPAAGRTPLGLDRLYTAPDGTPRTLIRWDELVQLRLDPVTKEEIGRAVRQPPRKSDQPAKNGRMRERRVRFVGYRKQEDETSRFVPGSEKAVSTVHEVLRMYHLENIGAHRIIKKFRSEGTKSSEGCDWNLSSIRNILENPIYIGKEVRHRWTKALYHKLGPNGPIPVKVDQHQLQKEGRKSVPQTERARDEWVLVDKPELKDFLPPDLRAAHTAYILKLFDEDTIKAKQARKSKKKNKSDDGPYLLSHILHSKQTGHPMRGDSNRKKTVSGEKYLRRYYFDYSTASKAISGLHARRVRAEELEPAVINAVFDVLLDQEWMQERVTAFLSKQQPQDRSLQTRRERLLAERDEINRRLKRIHKTSSHLTDEELEELVEEDNARVVEIRHAITAIDAAPVQEPLTAADATTALREQIALLPMQWRTIPNAELKQLLRAVIDSLTVDLETYRLNLSVVVPPTVFDRRNLEVAKGRVNDTSAWSSVTDSTPENWPRIAKIECDRERKSKCYTCRRHAA